MSKFVKILALTVSVLIGSSALFVWSEVRDAKVIPDASSLAQAAGEPSADFRPGS